MSETSRHLPPPLVTVVVPVYNKANTVIRTLESVAEQTLSNFECYVVNDGSTDRTEDVVLGYIKDDERFRYIKQENSGVAVARNRGVFAGSAPYVCCLDSDDAIAPEFLETCVRELEKDPTIGIAYTGLWYIKPDGSEGLSPWPGQFDYDEQVHGKNQIPTCNVARREVWKRLGGQRQRYALEGAGEEDAEFWLRAGAYGFNAKKVTDAGMFIYSWMSGLVSGSTSHKISNWRGWHPWVADGKHPFASVAKPKRVSHPVRQYDEPNVSVIIPVGEKHKENVIDALDSLEAQTYRGWEAIVVDDTGNEGDVVWQNRILDAYPYIRMVVKTPGQRGAGSARNSGARYARAPFLLFLDADDYLHPDCITDMLTAWESEQSIIYTDYVGRIITSEEDAKRDYGNRLLDYHPHQGQALVRFKSADYECEKAVIQPRPERNGYPYLWCLITALVPKKWHKEIGGFDEKMVSWEDWDYWIRLAKAGKCFTRVERELVLYRFYSGNRREIGLQSAPSLIQYLEDKYRDIETMGCGCRQKNNLRTAPASPPAVAAQRQTEVNNISDQDMVLCVYTSLNRGDHRVIGAATKFDYQYRTAGQRFLVFKADIAAQPQLFKPVTADKKAPKEEVVETPAPVPVETEGEPIKAERPFDLQTIPGITPYAAQKLNAANVHTLEDLIDFGADKLVKFKGIGEKRAADIIKFAERKKAGEL